MENDPLNPYAPPERLATPRLQVPIPWYTAIALAGSISVIAFLFSAMLTIDFVEGNTHARSFSVFLFMLLGYSSILVPIVLAICRKRFSQQAGQLQWFISIALPLGYACVLTILFLNLPNPF